jgi:hypothetical protein
MDVWTVGPTAAEHCLRSLGFSPSQASRLAAMRVRYQRGAFRKPTSEQKRLEFARWLIARGYLTEHIDSVETMHGAPAAGGEASPSAAHTERRVS